MQDSFQSLHLINYLPILTTLFSVVFLFDFGNRLSDSFFQTNSGAEPGFVVSDLGGGYIYRRENYRLSFNVEIKNIFGRFYSEQFVLAPARGRSFVVGTTLSFN